MSDTVPQRLPRAQRREQILTVATRLFAWGRPADVTLAEVADAAGVTRAILYRHVESKVELYRLAVRRARRLVESSVGTGPYDKSILMRLFDFAARTPDEFRLLFIQAPRETMAADLIEDHRRSILAASSRALDVGAPRRPWDDWVSRLVPEIAVNAVATWLDAGAPDPEAASRHLLGILGAAVLPHDQGRPAPLGS